MEMGFWGWQAGREGMGRMGRGRQETMQRPTCIASLPDPGVTTMTLPATADIRSGRFAWGVGTVGRF
jgi:hypothetical protein